MKVILQADVSVQSNTSVAHRRATEEQDLEKFGNENCDPRGSEKMDIHLYITANLNVIMN